MTMNRALKGEGADGNQVCIPYHYLIHYPIVSSSKINHRKVCYAALVSQKTNLGGAVLGYILCSPLGNESYIGHNRHSHSSTGCAGTKFALLVCISYVHPLLVPNVLYVDFIGAPFQLNLGESQDNYLSRTQGHLMAMAMAVNLYMASEFCDLSGGKIY